MRKAKAEQLCRWFIAPLIGNLKLTKVSIVTPIMVYMNRMFTTFLRSRGLSNFILSVVRLNQQQAFLTRLAITQFINCLFHSFQRMLYPRVLACWDSIFNSCEIILPLLCVITIVGYACPRPAQMYPKSNGKYRLIDGCFCTHPATADVPINRRN